MTQIALAADFLTALSRLPQGQQKKVRTFINQFQQDSTAASIHLEPIHDVRDDRIRTARVDLAYRAVLLQPRKGDLFVLLWVDHHDEAMAWARNRVFEINPVTGAIQVIESAAIVAAEQVAAAPSHTAGAEPVKDVSEYTLFETFTDADLLRTGLPRPLLPAVRALRAAGDLDTLEPFLPAEAYEALYWVANLGYSVDQALAETGGCDVPAERGQVDTEDIGKALTHPDSKRRFVLVDSDEELTRMLNAPLERWRVFLHPSQARLVGRHFSGPARVLGGAGTGKTVVAMHRARYLAQAVFTAPTDRILFTTYTKNLAENIQRNLATLCGPELARVEVVNLHSWAARFLNAQGVHLTTVTEAERDDCWRGAIAATAPTDFPEVFLRTEWKHVVQAEGIEDRAAYLRVARNGRGQALTRPQRAALWAVFEEYRRQLAILGKVEWVDLIRQARLYLARLGHILPYRAIIVDETQDWTPEDLRLLRQMIPPGPDDLFLVGDAHQRIYGRPVTLGQCGIQIRGRSQKLRINYRTTEEIRNWATSILTGQTVDDLDGGQDADAGYVSLLHGDFPIVRTFPTLEAELDFLTAEIHALQRETSPDHICVVARSHRQLQEDYMPAFRARGIGYMLLKPETADEDASGVRLATMHRVKGLEYPYIFIVGVNDGTVPLLRYVQELDAVEQAETVLQERCLLHVAATRAREGLCVSCWGTPSRFLLSMDA